MSVAAFEADRSLAEGTRQSAIGTAHATLDGVDLQAAVRSADRSFFGRVVASGLANGVPADGAREWLARNPVPPESFSRTDATSFALLGGRYRVTVAAGTFAEGASVALQNVAGDVFATFADVGSATVDLLWGQFNFALTGVVTDFSATVASTPYA